MINFTAGPVQSDEAVRAIDGFFEMWTEEIYL